mmetsp:Transcript_13836/g.25924  ORF Transcript_13836/g.25924 Transcript_13836/m.25924 type:complete len:95 (-) Transcript_13836:75-359(-)
MDGRKPGYTFAGGFGGGSLCWGIAYGCLWSNPATGLFMLGGSTLAGLAGYACADWLDTADQKAQDCICVCIIFIIVVAILIGANQPCTSAIPLP